jgi:hypothetical protein
LLDHEAVVGRADDRDSELAGQALEQARDREGVSLVETGGRLVGQEQRAPGGDCPGERDAYPKAQ